MLFLIIIGIALILLSGSTLGGIVAEVAPLTGDSVTPDEIVYQIAGEQPPGDLTKHPALLYNVPPEPVLNGSGSTSVINPKSLIFSI